MRARLSGFFFAASLLIGGAAQAANITSCTDLSSCQAAFDKATNDLNGYINGADSGQYSSNSADANAIYTVQWRDAYVDSRVYQDAVNYYKYANRPAPVFTSDKYLATASNFVSSQAEAYGYSDGLLATAQYSYGTASTMPGYGGTPTDPGTGGGSTTPTDPGTGGGSITPTEPGTGGGSTTPSDSDPSQDPLVEELSKGCADIIVAILAAALTMVIVYAAISATTTILRLIRAGRK